MIPGLIVLIIFFAFILIKSADFVIIATRRLAKGAGTNVFVLSAIILALGTSFPELFVGITSALEGNPVISLGDVIGSNIANMSLVLGLSALIAGSVIVRGNYIKREVFIAFAAGLLPLILLLDSSLNRVDGLILIVIYGAYTASFFRSRLVEIAQEHKEENFAYRFIRQFNHVDSEKRKELVRLFLGVAVMLFSADMIVKLSVNLADFANVSSLVIGMVIVAIGTSLPEFAFSLRSLRKHQPSMFFGNLLGSTVTNSTLVLGVVALIHPIQVEGVSKYFIATAAFALIYLTFWYFIKSKHRLDRWEAGVLILLYIIFVITVIV